jgi:hypothetical protein
VAIVALLIVGACAVRRVAPIVSEAFHAAAQEAQRRRAAP